MTCVKGPRLYGKGRTRAAQSIKILSILQYDLLLQFLNCGEVQYCERKNVCVKVPFYFKYSAAAELSRPTNRIPLT